MGKNQREKSQRKKKRRRKRWQNRLILKKMAEVGMIWTLEPCFKSNKTRKELQKPRK